MCVLSESKSHDSDQWKVPTNCPGVNMVSILILYMAKTNFLKWEIRKTKQDPTRSTSPDQWNVITQQIAQRPFSWTNEEELIRLLLIYAKGNVLTFYMIGNGDFMLSGLLIRKRQCPHCYNYIWWYLLKISPRKPFIVWNLNNILMYTWHF